MKTFRQKSMLARLSSGIGFSCRKRDKKATKEVAASKMTAEDSVDVFKRLWPKGALDEWRTAIEAARETHDNMTLPWRDDGYRLLRSDHCMEYSDATAAAPMELPPEPVLYITPILSPAPYCPRLPLRLSPPGNERSIDGAHDPPPREGVPSPSGPFPIGFAIR